MEILRRPEDLTALDVLRARGPLVLVPTMGALHEGHLSLVRAASCHGQAVVSVFVNPTQFGPGEDFGAYPRDEAADLALLGPAGAAAVFLPRPQDLYGGEREVTVQPGDRADVLCGAARPGHFAGVLTVVAKLFGLVRPAVAVFGRKDAQQCLVIQQMVQDLRMPVRLVDGATVRETDGLAMSSRNRYLDASARARAGCLFAALQAGRRLLVDGSRDRGEIAAAMAAALAGADRVDYAEVLRVPGLQPADPVRGPTLLAVAAQVGPARLIDNFVLDVQAGEVREGFLLGRW